MGAGHSQAISPEKFFDKLPGLDVCQTYAVFKLRDSEVEKEKAVDDMIDLEGTRGLQNCLRTPGPLNIDIEEVHQFYDDQVPSIRCSLGKMWHERFNDIFKEIKDKLKEIKENGGNASLPEIYLDTLSETTCPEAVGRAIANSKMKKIPNKKWLLYWFGLLKNYMVFRWRLAGAKSNGRLGSKTIANALMDIHYAAFLPWADGIATNDNGLKEIVKAFFPDKRIISNNE